MCAENIPFEKITLQDGFWLDRYRLNKEISMENVRKRFEETGRFDALRFNYLKTGKKPHFYFDSDAAKWIEAAACLMKKDREGMRPYEELIDSLADCMAAAQREDGYLNSYHQQIEPEKILTDRDHHELYCLGHCIEAAIAYHKATGKDNLLNIVRRQCELIYRVFLVEKSAPFCTPGHEEIELALFRLYRYTGEKKAYELARYFLETRGKTDEPSVYPDNRYGSQDDTDIYHLTQANGHCVRALYFYTGIADYCLETGDKTLLNNLDSVFRDITEKKMYLTGGVGSTFRSESFTVAYDLPNATAYSESCGAIAMLFFLLRMRRLRQDAAFGHTAERVLYNSLLSSCSLDGKSFFYENPLEINLAQRGREVAIREQLRERFPITERLEVFGCSCCPPNINRLLAQIGDFVCFSDGDRLTVEQYIACEIDSPFGQVCVGGDYAKNGRVMLSGSHYTADKIAVRIPEWCRELEAKLDGKPVQPETQSGYAVFAVNNCFELSLDFHIRPVFVAANPSVCADSGRVALTYGPLVYCLEGVDNGSGLNWISVSPQAAKSAEMTDGFSGVPHFTLPGFCDLPDTRLYFDAAECQKEPKTLSFIPYFAFANRGESDMAVWIRRAE